VGPTGYSGLYHLTQLAIDKIKIDRSFFDTSLDNQSDMVKAILALGKSLRMQITAESVEHEQLADWLCITFSLLLWLISLGAKQ
jgi:EAL domain-containing protein (putative c-di-GMP-specific phosphodiesterase class I)